MQSNCTILLNDIEEYTASPYHKQQIFIRKSFKLNKIVAFDVFRYNITIA
jgi:hypothetical protein